MQVDNDQTRALRRVGKRLAIRLHEVGIERTADEVADSLLMAADGYTLDAISNGYQYICGMRPMQELVADVTYLIPVNQVQPAAAEKRPSLFRRFIDLLLLIG